MRPNKTALTACVLVLSLALAVPASSIPEEGDYPNDGDFGDEYYQYSGRAQPAITSEPLRLEAVENEKVELPCEGENLEQFALLWYKGSTMKHIFSAGSLKMTTNRRIQVEGSGSKLIIHNVTAADSGEYTCRIGDSEDSVVKVTHSIRVRQFQPSQTDSEPQAKDESAEGKNASILVCGQKGSGISSTVRMLLGSFLPSNLTEHSTQSGPRSVITEYVVPIPGSSSSFLKIVDIDGISDGSLPEEDAYIQASLKTYLTHPEGLNSSIPTAVLIVSRFDDNQFNHNQSHFIQMLKRITDAERSVNRNEIPDINILLFSRFMMEVKSIQRLPKGKLRSLKSAAIEFVEGISPNIRTLVGENKGEDYGLNLTEDGTYRLPNRQYYPTNVFEAVANLAESNGVFSDATIVDTFAAFRVDTNQDELQVKASRAPFNIAPSSTDVEYFASFTGKSGQGDMESIQESSLRKLQEASQNLQEMFDDVLKKAEEERQRKQTQVQQHLEVLGQEGGRQLTELQKQINETTFGIQEFLQKQKEAAVAEVGKLNGTWTSRIWETFGMSG